MSIYNNVDSNINAILLELTQRDDNFEYVHEDIFQLIVNDNTDPLNTALASDFNISDIINTRIFTKPKLDVPEDETKTYFALYYWNGRPSGQQNTQQYDSFYALDVITHTTLWDISSVDGFPARRLNLLMDKLITLILETDIIGMKDNLTLYMPPRRFSPNEVYQGYQALFKSTNSVGC